MFMTYYGLWQLWVEGFVNRTLIKIDYSVLDFLRERAYGSYIDSAFAWQEWHPEVNWASVHIEWVCFANEVVSMPISKK